MQTSSMLRHLVLLILLSQIGWKCTQAHGRTLQENRTHGPVRVKRKFALEGGAVQYLTKLNSRNPGQLSRVLRRSHLEGIALPALAQLLDEDPDLDLDLNNEVLVYECAGVISDGLLPQEFEPDPLAAQAFQLSSRPTATRKIFLDFKGATITETSWNARYSSTIVQPPYDKDNSPASFSSSELNDIVAIWRAVAEDYAIFDVDVTTIKPASFDSSMWVSIGGDASWYGSTAGGVANVGVFGHPYYQPAFVFSKNLGPDYAKYIWEAVSHEVGHTLGLLHDGVTGGTSYYSGHGDWAPIMGAAYHRPLTTWDKGEYANSNQPQDDVAIISSFLPLLQQSAGDGIATATPLFIKATNGAFTGTADGVVVQPEVANYYSFLANAAGAATVEVDVMLPWANNDWARSNLDVQLVVYAPNGNVIDSINPAGVSSSNGLGIAATIVQLPAAGTYYAAVSGASFGDPKATGYSNYGTRGNFKLMVKLPATDGTPPSNPVSPPPADPIAVQPPSIPGTPNPTPKPQKPEQRIVEVSEIRISKSCNRVACMCRARVFLRDDITNTRLTATARVFGSWTASPRPPSWDPYPYLISDATSNGFADLSAPRQGVAGSCLFRVTDVRAPGYIFGGRSVKRGMINVNGRTQVRTFRSDKH